MLPVLGLFVCGFCLFMCLVWICGFCLFVVMFWFLFVWFLFLFFFNCKSNSWCYEENSSLFCVHVIELDFLEMRVSSILLGEKVGRRDERCLAYKVKPPKVFLNIKAWLIDSQEGRTQEWWAQCLRKLGRGKCLATWRTFPPVMLFRTVIVVSFLMGATDKHVVSNILVEIWKTIPTFSK